MPVNPFVANVPPPAAADAVETGPELNDASEDPMPAHLGRYRVVSLLGKGGFGVVYQACDDELERPVAIKVPRRDRLTRPGDVEAYLAEARVVARLEHPHIVPVLDVGRTDDGLCFVVSRFIPGRDLSRQIKEARLPVGPAAALVATVAGALHHAHTKGLVHRDVKPGNILIDLAGTPYLGDFGLALREQDYGKGSGACGTPAYMSPEQANGEGHRVDGRSDVFSLGVVFYELLTGRRPFQGDTVEVLRQIAADEPRPPRQADDTIPKELERICLKALAKRASARYTTARDLAEDLRHFHGVEGDGWRVAGKENVLADGSPAAHSPATHHSPPSTPLKIVPKGLRSFDAQDADFFLELLPGPRDRDGLPDSIRFWKTRLEETDPDGTFTVGLIYGPSGCGKSSLVKAGLLPRLSARVIAIYVEATADQTETRLLNGLRKRYPALPGNLDLKDTLRALRRGQGLPAGQKVVIVLDQFEQWLHARKAEPNTELAQALRQCDGSRIQCVVMVRDDFWMAVTRFLSELEIELVQGKNFAAADLFDQRHAQKVLAAFGRAYGALPESAGPVPAEQQAFLDLVVSGLGPEGKVICLRLALVAEMMKGKPWTPAALKQVGGTEGVGVAFLEETFSSPAANPKHRLHQQAARAVLKALLAEAGTDIKGHMRSHAELLAASGYAGRPKEFDALLRILDSEIRLITPTDPEGVEAVGVPALAGLPGDRLKPVLQHEPGVGVPALAGLSEDRLKPVLQQEAAKYYQLTHDYLVPSLRDWLTRKQKETRRGRAELLLADRAAVWNTRPENRQLPSLLQWFNLQVLTPKRNWTPPQRKMMRRAGRYHLLRGLMFTSLLAGVVLLGWEALGRLEAHNLRGRLLGVKTAEVPDVVKAMAPYRRWAEPLLRQAYTQAQEQGDAGKQLHASLALLPMDPSQVRYLNERLLQGDPDEVVVIREALTEYKHDLVADWWALLKNRAKDQEQRFRAAAALARHDADNPFWDEVNREVAARLMAQKPFEIARWTAAFKPVANQLLTPLAGMIEADKGTGSEISVLAGVYGSLAADVPEAVARLEEGLTEQPKADPEYKIAKQQVNVAVALLVMGRGEKVWPLLKHGPDPTLRSYLIERLGPGGVDPHILLARLAAEPDKSIRRALVLSLGEFSLNHLPEVERQNLRPRLQALYRDDPDPGIHGAAEWVLRRWLKDEQFRALKRSLVQDQFAFTEKDWCVTREGHTMMLVRKPGQVMVGEGIDARTERIDWSYAIASKEVTVEQFTRFRQVQRKFKECSPTKDCPMMEVSWDDAAAYCNWLCKQERIPKDEWCYEAADKKGEYKTAANHLQREGYRLATEAEWEYACRAGATTAYGFGEAEELLGKYCWYDENSKSKSHPVGQLKSNDLGLFDMHGNAWERCDDPYKPGMGGAARPPLAYRGGSWLNELADCRAAPRITVPAARYALVGLRVARAPVGSRTK